MSSFKIEEEENKNDVDAALLNSPQSICACFKSCFITESLPIERTQICIGKGPPISLT